MLKDQSCYANDPAYARALFLHKGKVEDYPIDPRNGAFVRVIFPCPDQPKLEKGWYIRPQFLFMTRGDMSQMYELDDVEEIAAFFADLRTSYLSGTPQRSLKFGLKTGSDMIVVDRSGEVAFKTNLGPFAGLTCVAVKDDSADLHTSARQAQILDNLVDVFQRIAAGEPARDKIFKLDREMMTTLHREDGGARNPVIITGRKFKDRQTNYVILSKDNDQRMVFSANPSGRELIDNLMTTATASCNDLADKPVGDGVVTLMGNAEGKIDPNMEYTNCRVVNFISGNRISVILNSDRYPGNTKFVYPYEQRFHRTLHKRLLDFMDDFIAL